MKKQPTMRDVAKLAEVTQPTVSYVINNTANISDEVRERVHRAIRELDYKPNYFARGLKTNKSNMIGIVVPDILNEFFAFIINETEKLLARENYGILIQSTNYDATLEEKALRSLVDYNVEAIIVAYQPGSRNSRTILRNYHWPVVIFEGGTACKGIPCINLDNFYGGWTATQYLLEQGRRRVAFIGQNSYIEALRDRCRGFLEAVKEYGASGEVFETSGPGNKWEEGIRLGERIVRYPLDGIVVSSDVIAVGILKSFLTAGKRIPQDIAVVGYDDVPLARLVVPALTTMAQPVQDLCSIAVQKILRALKGEPITGELLRPRLIVRETA
jgi:DNA-binding LacI/PurR family transcriptional regulator